MSRTLQVTATVAAAGTTTPEVDIPDGYDLVGLFAPDCVSTALTFTAAPASGGTFSAVTNNTQTAISFTLSSTPKYMALDNTLLKGLQFIKLVCGTTETSGAVFTLVLQKQPT